MKKSIFKRLAAVGLSAVLALGSSGAALAADETIQASDVSVISAAEPFAEYITGDTGNITAYASSAKLNCTGIVLVRGETKSLSLSGASGKVRWSSSNPAVASVNSSGKVTARSKGSAKITASCGKKVYTCNVKVNSLLGVSTTNLSFTSTSSKTLVITFKGNGGRVTYSIPDDSIVKCTASAKKFRNKVSLKVKPIANGVTTITLTNSKNSETATVNVVSTGFNSAGFSNLKSSIKSSGLDDTLNDTPIKYIADSINGYTFMAIYVPSTDRLSLMSTDPNGEYLGLLSLEKVNGSKSDFMVAYESGSNYYAAETSIKRSTFKSDSTYTFSLADTNFAEASSVQSTCNSFLQTSMYGWEYLIEQTGTSLTDLGFVRYSAN